MNDRKIEYIAVAGLRKGAALIQASIIFAYDDKEEAKIKYDTIKELVFGRF